MMSNVMHKDPAPDSDERKDAHTALVDDYRRAGFGRSLQFGTRPALVIVDVVQAYVVPESPLYARAFEDALAANVVLVEAARKTGVPVIFTGVQYSRTGADGGVFFRKIPALQSFVVGNPLAEFPASLRPGDNEVVVTKQYASAFFGTSLASTLTSMGVDTVMVTGFSTSGCVRATTLDAMQHGFVPFVVREACGDRDPQVQESNLFDLQAKYAEVVCLQQVLGLLQGRAQG
ncbi:isochorismatase family protein [Paraburkholderia phymatum]|uniref:isochorismatase family protein n=1 Tax=Paraburkholderia phymatum TaxID=148447 RepID=UPI003180814E